MHGNFCLSKIPSSVCVARTAHYLKCPIAFGDFHNFLREVQPSLHQQNISEHLLTTKEKSDSYCYTILISVTPQWSFTLCIPGKNTPSRSSGEILLHIIPYFILVIVRSAWGFLQAITISISDVLLIRISIHFVYIVTFWLLSTFTAWTLCTDAEEVFVDDVAYALQ